MEQFFQVNFLQSLENAGLKKKTCYMRGNKKPNVRGEQMPVAPEGTEGRYRKLTAAFLLPTKTTNGLFQGPNT